MKVTASAPGKLMLFGEHAVVYGWPCIVTAVNQRMKVTVEPNGIGELHVSAPQLGLREYRKKLELLGKQDVPKQVRFIEQLVANFYKQHHLDKGIRVITESEFLSSYGFGSSAAVTVALGKAINKFFGKKISQKELFKMCFQAVVEVQGLGSGFDVAAAVYGRTLYYVSSGKVIRKLKINSLPVVVGYTGIKADTPTLVRQVAELRRENRNAVDEVFKKIGRLVDRAVVEIEKGEYRLVGKLMTKNQKLLARLHVSSLELDQLIKAAIKGRAWGAKLSGAGGGDCMIGVVDNKLRKRIEESIEQAGGEIIKIELGAEGVRLGD